MSMNKNNLIAKTRRLKLSLGWILSYSLALFALLFTARANATYMDTDTYCANYGCVIICDSVACNIYDVWNFNTSTTIAVGQNLIPYATNPIIGAGATPYTANYRNTLTKIAVPGANIATEILINGQTSGGVLTDNATTGYFNAADTITAFGLNAATDIAWEATPAAGVTAGGTNPQRHTFFYCSRGVGTDVMGVIGLNSSTLDMPTTTPLANIGYSVGYTRTGTDAGITYGNNASNGAIFTAGAVTNLGAFTVPAVAASFTAQTRVGNVGGTNLAAQMRQCVRFEANYTMPNFDLSLGRGDVNIRIDYNFRRR